MEPLIRHVSDTALWAATYRARETDRPDAVFRDLFARRLAGERGERIAEQMKQGTLDNSWAWVMRTYLIDRAIERCLAAGTDLILNLAAGLDARPYRMDLPPNLRWVEVDFDEILEYKTTILDAEQPRCLPLERHGLDLSNRLARRAFFDQLGRGLVITEGYTVYLSDEEVADLARDLAHSEFDYWVLDLASPALLKFLQATTGRHAAEAGTPLRFGARRRPRVLRALWLEAGQRRIRRRNGADAGAYSRRTAASASSARPRWSDLVRSVSFPSNASCKTAKKRRI